MAQTGHLTGAPAAAAGPWLSPVTRLRIIILLTILVIWEGVAASGILLREVVPSVVVIGRALAELLFHPDLKWPVDIGIGSLRFVQQLWVPAFYWHLYVTVMEVATALVIGGTTGLAVGLALGANPFLSKTFERYLYYLGPTPKIVFFPVMIMWFGVGPESKIAMGTLSCFFPIVLTTARGLREVEPDLLDLVRTLKGSRWQVFTKIQLPGALPYIFAGMKVAAILAVAGAIVGEFLGSDRGLGYLMLQVQVTLDTAAMFMAVILITLIGMLLYGLVLALEHALVVRDARIQ